MKQVAISILALLGWSGVATAQVVASDDFSYTGLLTANGWVAGGSVGNDPPAANGQIATLRHSQDNGPEESDYLPFPPIGTTEAVYAHLRFEVPTPGVTPIVGFRSTIASLNNALLNFTFPTGPGDYRLEIEAFDFFFGSAAGWPADLSFDTQYSLVMRWDPVALSSTLWLDPVDAASTSVTATISGGPAPGPTDRFWLNQPGDALAQLFQGFVEIDDVVVGKSFADVLPPSGGPTTYCTGKTNSSGCVPFISSSGTPSATSTSPFRIQAADVLPGEVGFILYSFKKSNLDFHGGKLCVKAPVTRLLPPKTPKATGGPPCTGMLKRDVNPFIQSGNDPLMTVGQTVLAQWRMRDPLDPAGFGDSLTNGLRFTIAP